MASDDLAYTVAGSNFGLGLADRWARNRQQQVENQRREREDRDKLLAAFGEDAVLDGTGRVDVNASSIRRKERLDKEAAQAAEGFKAVYQSIPGASSTPMTEAPKMLPPNYQPEAPKTEAQSFDFLSTDETPSFGRRIVAPPITQAESDLPVDRPRFVPVAESSRILPPEAAPEPPPDQPRYIPVQAAPAIVPTDASPAPRAMIVPNGAVLRPPDTVESSPLPPATVSSVPHPATVPRAILPPGTIQAPARPQIPDLTGMPPAKAAAIMKFYPQALADYRKQIHDMTVAETQLEVIKQSGAMKEELAKINNTSKSEITDKVTDRLLQLQQERAELAERIQTMKGTLKLSEMGLKATDLEKYDAKRATEYGAQMANKENAAAALSDAIRIAKDPSLPQDVKYATLLNTFKTINSSDFRSDAVSQGEERRVGGLLGFDWNPVRGYFATGHILPDVPGFIQQVELKISDLNRESATIHDRVKKLYAQYGKDIDNPRGLTPGAAAPAAASPTNSAPVRVTSKAQYDSLSPGTPYTDDSGKPKVKK